MTEIQQHTMSVRDAEKLTERIRYMAMSVRDGVEKLQKLVSDAQEGQAHLALGYPSWTAYIAEVMGDEPLQLRNREERREVVSWLAGQGMSSRAIAPVVGTHHDTVARDIRSVVSTTDEPRTVKSIDGIERTFQPRPAPTFDETPDWDPVDSSRPEPKESPKPQRRPLPDQFRDATVDLRKITDRLEKLIADDRFPRNREQVALIHQSDLSRASTALAKVIDALNNN